MDETDCPTCAKAATDPGCSEYMTSCRMCRARWLLELPPHARRERLALLSPAERERVEGRMRAERARIEALRSNRETAR